MTAWPLFARLASGLNDGLETQVDRAAAQADHRLLAARRLLQLRQHILRRGSRLERTATTEKHVDRRIDLADVLLQLRLLNRLRRVGDRDDRQTPHDRDSRNDRQQLYQGKSPTQY